MKIINTSLFYPVFRKLNKINGVSAFAALFFKILMIHDSYGVEIRKFIINVYCQQIIVRCHIAAPVGKEKRCLPPLRPGGRT